MSKASVLELHGTILSRLKPSSIIHTALRDLELRRKKAGGEASMQAVYAFHREHVRHAQSAHDLIRRALDGYRVGMDSSKRETRIIYGDREVLKDALAMIGENI